MVSFTKRYFKKFVTKPVRFVGLSCVLHLCTLFPPVMLMPQEKIGHGTIGIPSKEPLALDLSCDDFAMDCYRNYFSSCSNINNSMQTVLFYLIIKKNRFMKCYVFIYWLVLKCCTSANFDYLNFYLLR